MLKAFPDAPLDTSLHEGRVTDGELRWLYSPCDDLVAAGFEGFGLTPIEAICGKPTAALRAGRLPGHGSGREDGSVL
jgi:hypothetical protein